VKHAVELGFLGVTRVDAKKGPLGCSGLHYRPIRFPNLSAIDVQAILLPVPDRREMERARHVALLTQFNVLPLRLIAKKGTGRHKRGIAADIEEEGPRAVHQEDAAALLRNALRSAITFHGQRTLAVCKQRGDFDMRIDPIKLEAVTVGDCG